MHRLCLLGLQHPLDLAAVVALPRLRLVVAFRELVSVHVWVPIAHVRLAGVPVEVVEARRPLAVRRSEVRVRAIARASAVVTRAALARLIATGLAADLSSVILVEPHIAAGAAIRWRPLGPLGLLRGVDLVEHLLDLAALLVAALLPVYHLTLLRAISGDLAPRADQVRVFVAYSAPGRHF